MTFADPAPELAPEGLVPAQVAAPPGGVAAEQPAAAAGAYYDARRGIHYAKPALRGWMHLLWFAGSLVAGGLLVAWARGAVRITADAIYAVSVSALFGASALYHRGTWTTAWRRRLQRLDHMMIFVMIAGTATPAFLVATHGPLRLSCLIVVWGLALTACAVHMAWMNAPELVIGAIFVGLGWASGLVLPAVWIHAGAAAGALVLAGGLLYTTGAVCYRRRRPDPCPSVFGYHEVFHAFVCVAAACQYVAIARLAG